MVSELILFDGDSDSDLSSTHSSRVSSPSPASRYLSPPISQSSIPGSPCCEMTESSSASQSDREGPPAAKRRRISEKMPRDTRYLDLEQFREQPDEDQAAELDRLLRAIRFKRKIVVVAGAGISVSAGSQSVLLVCYVSLIVLQSLISDRPLDSSIHSKRCTI